MFINDVISWPLAPEMATLLYRKLLMRVGNELTDEQLTAIKLLCKDILSTAKAEDVDTGQKLFTALDEAGCIAPTNVSLLKTLLEDVRTDLIRKVEEYEEEFGKPSAKLPAGLEGKVLTKQVINDIGGELARDWRTLARRLDMKNEDILGIASDYRDSLKEQGIQMLYKWYRDMASGKDEIVDVVRAQQAAAKLDEALRKAGLTSIADEHFGRVFEEARRS
ncbi:FAS-associated death domain protein-like [Oscarella lobularis]|uniref:FAS-associated death domain protein-like n=1 Tax=Oscarella lobularis TaxID=121494 RepID=UPI00331433A9